jgi:hypothetical protein
MSVTINPVTSPASKGQVVLFTSIIDVTLDNSYTTGGYALTAAQVGLNEIFSVLPAVAVASGNFLQTAWNPATGKLQIFYPTGGTTAPAAVAQPIVKSGGSTASAVDATTPHITPGAGIEVANATDLSAFTVRMVAFGR